MTSVFTALARYAALLALLAFNVWYIVDRSWGQPLLVTAIIAVCVLIILTRDIRRPFRELDKFIVTIVLVAVLSIVATLVWRYYQDWNDDRRAIYAQLPTYADQPASLG